ncbi:hypothetical protein CFC21_094475 [Triticum aestivum]|nr:hypothetical protein CFC21_094475 [Triticum aestivum]
MRCTQMLLLPIAFLVLSSDVIMEASAGIGIDPISCMSNIIQPSPKPCNNQTCRKACVERIGYGTEGECVTKGCKCTYCTNWPPRQSTNEP